MRMLILFLSLFLSEISLAKAPLNACSVSGPKDSQGENLLGALTQWPTPAFMVLDQMGTTRFVNPSKVYADVLALNEKSLIVNDIEELRFLSQTLAHSEILLVLKGKIELSEEKAKKVLSVAKLLDIKLSLVWLNETPSPKVLKDLISQSGGRSFESSDLLRRAVDKCQKSLAGR